jgi:hypothetical protein
VIELLRRFLVVQALMLWQGGFLFYTAVVVPTGTAEFTAFEQSRVTRVVTNWMNALGVVTLVILAWDQWATRPARGRWLLWSGMTIALAGLAVLHPMIEARVDYTDGRISDYTGFYARHRIYLWVSTIQWAIGLVYVVLMLRAWARFRSARET